MQEVTIKKIITPGLRRRLMYTLSFLSDEVYLKLFYKTVTGRKLNLNNPVLFSEKENWLKIHNRNPEYKKLVNKLTVREIVAKEIGEGHTFPILGVWDSFDDIDFNKLPNQFVLKCNHDSGGAKVIHDKSKLTTVEIKDLRKHFRSRLKHDFYYAGREWPYKGMERKIFAEEMMVSDNPEDKDLTDYRFFCFNGEPEILFVGTDMSQNWHFDWFDMDFNKLDIFSIHPSDGKELKKPSKFEEMKTIARKLSKGKPFVRIDLYQINGKVYFGEETFFHGGGLCLFSPIEWEKKLGDLVDLSLAWDNRTQSKR